MVASRQQSGAFERNGNELSSTKRCQLNRLRHEQSRARWQSKAERNLGYGLGEVQRLGSSLGLADRIRNRACVRFRNAHAEQLAVGRSLESVAPASVYAMCRCLGLRQTRTEIAACAPVTKISSRPPTGR
ncbi:hypothetical protein [Haloterrigena turkmenica]|uniref:hypothetical protein n=1 Tax=Haloterrigena turkmenica TaxID=62320 RepID=UPI00299F0E17|nr:hypothetical protein [Haloterrigena turkmenica]